MAWWLFQNVVITAALALAVAAICRTTRIGPVARHALWVVVLVKFVTPPLLVWPWAAPDPFRFSTLSLEAEDRRDQDSAGGIIHTESASPAVESVNLPAAVRNPAADEEIGSAPGRAFATVWPWLFSLWLTGSLGLLAIEGIRLVRLSRSVRRGRPADPALERRVATLCTQLGIRAVAIRVLPGSAPPAVWCLGRPQLLWPEELGAAASEVCVDALLLHELAHVARRDHIVGWLELAAGVIWWWNPLFWFVRSALREQAELSCDAWVISTLPTGRRAYAESLLALSGAAPRGHVSMAVVGVRASTRRVLERRLAMIMQGRAPLRLTRIGLVSLAVAAALVLPAWAAQQDPPPPPPPPPARVQTPKPPPPPPVPVERDQRVRVQPRPPAKTLTVRINPNLPADVQELVRGFEAEVDAIQREADQKIAARRESLVKTLEARQDEHTKAGRLDEALAIRDYLRSGLSDRTVRGIIRRKNGAR
jgi:beta-lactamase regulating signal transducer with metallopeptidase domain